MANKKSKTDIDSLRSELQGLSEAVWALRDHVYTQRAAAAAASAVPRPDLARDLSERVDDEGAQGIVVDRGVFRDRAGTREYRWDFERTAVDLLTIDEETVARTCAAIGHRQRLAILKTVLDAPTSATDLVTTLNLGTTGAAYHHLNVLQAADLVVQESRGMFSVQPQRVSAIFAMLAGVASANDTTWTSSDVGAEDAEGTDESDLDESAPKKKKKKSS